jgi:ATP-binding cassette subfamily F protein 3
MALAQFEGTLILVSHDRHLLRATTDQFMLVANHRLQPFDGDLDDYRDWLLQHAAQAREDAKSAKAANAGSTVVGASAGSGAGAPAGSAAAGSSDAASNRKDQRRQEAELRQRLAQRRKPLQTRIAKIEKEMDGLNAEKATLDAFIADTANYAPAMKPKLTEALKKQADVHARLEALEAEWLDAQEELEQIG